MSRVLGIPGPRPTLDYDGTGAFAKPSTLDTLSSPRHGIRHGSLDLACNLDLINDFAHA